MEIKVTRQRYEEIQIEDANWFGEGGHPVEVTYIVIDDKDEILHQVSNDLPVNRGRTKSITSANPNSIPLNDR